MGFQSKLWFLGLTIKTFWQINLQNKTFKNKDKILELMATRIGTARRKTRHKLSKPRSEKGKLSLRKYFQEFKEGDRVTLLAEPAVQKGMYYPRFHNCVGTVKKRRGFCYELTIKDMNKEKTVIVHPVHLRKQ